MKKQWKKVAALCTAAMLCMAVLNGCSSPKEDTQKNPDSGQQENAQNQQNQQDQQNNGDDIFGSFTGTSAGKFTTQDINGNTYTEDIFKDYELTMINVFTTWCTPCIQEIPDLELLRQEVADKGVNVIGVVLDVLDENGEIVKEQHERAQLLAKETGANYPFLLPDSTYMNGRLIGIEGFPETFFVDKDGNIVGETYSGSGGLEDWREVVEQELKNLEANQ